MKRKFIWWFLTVVAILATASLASATSWSTGQYNFQRTGYNPSSSLDQLRLTKVWSYSHPTHVIYRGFPTEYKGQVYQVFTSFTAALTQVVCLDINTGAVLWTHNLASSGTAGRGTCTVVTVDTTGSGDFGDLVYVADGSSGGAAGIACLRAADGTQKWFGNTSGTVRYGQPVVADTNGDGSLDIVIVGSESNGNLRAWNAANGGVPAWSVSTDPGRAIFYGPSLSTDNKVVYAGTYTTSGVSGIGKVVAVNTTTGALINSFSPLGSGADTLDWGFPSSPIYIDDSTVVAFGYDKASPGFVGAQTNGRLFILDRNVNFKARSNDVRRMGGGFFQGAAYPDPVSGDTFFIFNMENGAAVALNPIMARAWSIHRVRTDGGMGTTNERRWNQFSCYNDIILGEGPIAVANAPDPYGAILVNSDGNFAAEDGKLYFLPTSTLAWGGGTANFDYWNKDYLQTQSISFRNNTGNLVTDGSGSAGIVAVVSEGYGNLHAFYNSPTPRARWVDESFCYADVLMNIPFPFDGNAYDTVTFFNIGDGSGAHSASATVAAQMASSLPKNIANAKVEPRLTSARRERLSNALSDEMTVTSKGQFLKQTYSMADQMMMEDQFPEMFSKGMYTSKQRGTPTVAGTPAWLTVTDLGSSPTLPGGSTDVELNASSATLAKGTYFADLHLTVAPDEPDPDFYGGTDIIVPIELIVGFLKNEEVIAASDVSLIITNVGQLGNFEHGAGGTGAFLTSFPTASGDEFFAGTIVIDKDTTNIFWHNNDTTGLYLADQIMVKDSVLPGSLTPNTPLASAYIAQVNACTTAFLTNTALAGKDLCSLRVELMTFGLWDGAFCDTSIVLKYVITNIGSNTITGLNIGQWCDWDQSPLPGTDTMRGDPTHNVMWNFETTGLTTVFGHLRMPGNDDAVTGYSVNNPTFLHPNGGHNWRHKQLDSLMHLTTWDLAGADPAVGDKGLLMHVNNITLAPGDKYLDEYIVFGWDNSSGVDFNNSADRLRVIKVWLRQNGFYRGDVNTDNRGNERSTAGADLGPAANGGGINVVDVVYLANYVLKATARPWPFDDQGDINCDGIVTLADVISLANYVFKGTNVPVDKNRFLPTSYQALFSRSSIWQNANWR